MKIIEEAEKTSKCAFLEEEGARTRVREHQRGARSNTQRCFKRRQLSTRAVRGATELQEGENRNHEGAMTNLLHAESSRSNQELFAPTKASLRYPESRLHFSGLIS